MGKITCQNNRGNSLDNDLMFKSLIFVRPFSRRAHATLCILRIVYKSACQENFVLY